MDDGGEVLARGLVVGYCISWRGIELLCVPGSIYPFDTFIHFTVVSYPVLYSSFKSSAAIHDSVPV